MEEKDEKGSQLLISDIKRQYFFFYKKLKSLRNERWSSQKRKKKCDACMIKIREL